jgi:hypothetical protein
VIGALRFITQLLPDDSHCRGSGDCRDKSDLLLYAEPAGLSPPMP